MFTILVADDNQLIVTKKERIMQKSKLVDDLCFLVRPTYKGYNMEDYTVTMLYCLPESRKAVSETLTKSDEMHGEFLQYILPFDTALTSEAGDVKVKLSFVLADLDTNGKPIQRVRKTDEVVIPIVSTDAWGLIVPDSMLDALDQRILKQDAQIKELAELGKLINDTKADNIHYNKASKELQLSSGGKAIGDVVIIGSCEYGDTDGVPAVDF